MNPTDSQNQTTSSQNPWPTPEPTRPMMAQPGITPERTPNPWPTEVVTSPPAPASDEAVTIPVTVNPTPVVPVSTPIPVVTPTPTPAPSPPKPTLTIPVYSVPSTPTPQPAPKPIQVTVSETPTATPPVPIAPVASTPTFAPAPEPAPQPQAIPSQMFQDEKRPQKGKVLPVFAAIMSFLMVTAAGGYGYMTYVAKKQQSPIATKTEQVATAPSAVKGANTATSLEEAKARLQPIGDKLIGYMKSGGFDAAYALTSPEFQSVTSSGEFRNIVQTLQPSAQQASMTLLSVNCYPNTSEAEIELTPESLCGGIYGFKDPTSYKKYHYIAVVTDYHFATIHSLRGFPLNTTTQAQAEDALQTILKNVKTVVDQ